MAAKRRKCWAWVLCVAMMLSMIPVTSWADEGDVVYEYYDNGEWKTGVLKQGEYTEVTGGFSKWSEGWYVVPPSAEALVIGNRVSVSGNVHLVLENGSNLDCNLGIHVPPGSSLTIYAEASESSESKGKLRATGKKSDGSSLNNAAGIGGNEGESAGEITIHGGCIESIAGGDGAGIGGGQNGSGGRINIFGGTINAIVAAFQGTTMPSYAGAGIGGGYGGKSGTIHIGGTANVTATGGVHGGAGIGGGANGNCQDITISGGNINATGRGGGAGIGAGDARYGQGTIKISDAHVIAMGSTQSGGYGSAGIGGGGSIGTGSAYAGGNIIVNSGYIEAYGAVGEAPHDSGDGIGDGGGYTEGETSTFSTGANGCATIFAYSGDDSGKAIADTSGKENLEWRGIIFENGVGGVNGDQTLTSDLTIASGQSLVIPANTTLTVPQGVTLTNNGTITGSGTLKGTVAGNPPESTIDDGLLAVTVGAEPTQGGTVEGAGRYEKGSTVTLNATPAKGYHFVGWKTGDSAIENTNATYSFTIEDDCHLTAIFALHKPGDWQQDANGHWRTCTNCDALIEQIEHVWQNGACTICGYVCSHSGGQSTCEHRAQCVMCGEDYGALSEHAYLYHERVAPTYTAEGMAAHYECSVCGQLFNEGKVETTREALILPHLDWPVVVPPDPEPEPSEEPEEELPPSEVVLPFNDVVEGAWYHDAVADVYARGWMTGTSDTNFAPEQAMTRAMVAATLHRMEGSPLTKASGFTDVAPGTWYEEAVAWAQQAGVVHGFDDGTFQPNAIITREQLAAMLQNYSMYKGEHTDARQDLNVYSDADAVSAWAQDALSWACAEGVLQGMTETSLSPQSSATRAQMAAVLLRLA